MTSVFGQKPKAYDIAATVTLDSIVIKAQKKGFDVADFIEMVQTDDTFYKAFKNLRTAAYSWTCDMSFQNKKDNELASYQSQNTQHWDGQCRWMTIEHEQSTGKFYRKSKETDQKYYTAKLYERLFCTKGKICKTKSNDENWDARDDEDDKGMEGHVNELKKLIFSPGQFADVPFIKKKTAIFSEDMREYYDFSITSGLENGIDSYVFSAQVKEEFESKQGKTVIKKLVTTFSKTDFQVIKRIYTLSNSTAVYTFDVNMEVDLQLKDGTYYPARILYDGYWNVPFKKYEKGQFEVYFILP